MPDAPRGRMARYHALPEKVRMVLTAILGALTGLVTYEILYALNPFEPRATSSWTVSFLIGVVRQHELHRRLTFSHDGPYWASLRRAYVMYSGSLLFGTGLNGLLTEVFGVHHRLAWFCCLMSTATISLSTHLRQPDQRQFRQPLHRNKCQGNPRGGPRESRMGERLEWFLYG